jgi:hypothetical protein
MAIGSRSGIVRAIEPLLHEHELRLVVQPWLDDPVRGPRCFPRLEADSPG